MPDRAYACPWQNFPTHRKNRALQVNGDQPIVYGYCAQTDACSSCAGTGFKPNILLQQGRPTDFVECPHCEPEAYKRRVARLQSRSGR